MSVAAIHSSRLPALHDATAATSPSAKRSQQAREALGEFVANTFYGTLLKLMNESMLKGKYFHGGRGEQIFKGQWSM